jgi:hypothetical protein
MNIDTVKIWHDTPHLNQTQQLIPDLERIDLVQEKIQPHRIDNRIKRQPATSLMCRSPRKRKQGTRDETRDSVSETRVLSREPCCNVGRSHTAKQSVGMKLFEPPPLDRHH